MERQMNATESQKHTCSKQLAYVTKTMNYHYVTSRMCKGSLGDKGTIHVQGNV